MKYTAMVTYKPTKERKLITSEYPTKKAFKSDLQANDYTVHGVYTDNDLMAREYGFTSYKAMKKYDDWVELKKEEIQARKWVNELERKGII